MKKLLIPLIAGLTLGNALLTWAGPDWQAIGPPARPNRLSRSLAAAMPWRPKLLQVLQRARRTPRWCNSTTVRVRRPRHI